MLLPCSDSDFRALIASRPPRGLQLPATPIAPVEILAMLRELAARIATGFEPAAWLIVEGDHVVGLCSLTRPPADGVLDIGYGIAPCRQGTGVATRAVAGLVAWARGDARVHTLTAETAISNFASQRVLERNGFLRTGDRVDPEDGPLLCWELRVR